MFHEIEAQLMIDLVCLLGKSRGGRAATLRAAPIFVYNK